MKYMFASLKASELLNSLVPLKLFTTCFLLLFIFSQHSFAGKKHKIKFKDKSWDKALQQAQTENRPIFVKTYASYCMPCKMMDKEVFSDPEVAAFFNTNFINFKVDMQSELGGIFNLAYEVSAIPDLLFFGPNGEISYREIGGQSKEAFMDMARTALSQMDFTPIEVTEELLLAYQEEENYYEMTEYDTELGIQNPSDEVIEESTFEIEQPQPTVSRTNRSAEKHQFYSQAKQIDQRLQNMRMAKGKLYSDRNLGYIFHNSMNLQSEAIDLLIRQQKTFEKQYGELAVVNQILEAVHEGVYHAVVFKDWMLFQKAENIVRTAKLENRDEVLYQIRLVFYEGSLDWDNYSRVVDKQIRKTGQYDAYQLNVLASKLCQNTNDTGLLSRALGWCKSSLKERNMYFNQYTYAQILFKMGRLPGAKKACLKAISLAHDENQSPASAQELLNKINRTSR